MIKVLGFALYGPLAASTRYRLCQYVGGLADHGVRLEVRHLLGDEYLRRSFAGQSLPVAALMRSACRRLVDLRKQGTFDLEMVYAELFPLFPGRLEQALLREPYVYDFDDAFYLKYRTGRLSMMRPLLGGKFDQIIRNAASVTAGNRLLASYAQQHNAHTHILPTVVDTHRYQARRAQRTDKVFTVGWIGSPSTAPYLAEVIEPLSEIGKEGAVRLVVIGGKAPSVPGVEVVELAWDEASEVDELNRFDVGIMPLPDSDWARGKCAFKLIQYMACGLPVIASPVGANNDVVTGECGLMAASPAEWTQALRMLRDSPTLREEMGHAGRQRVQDHYSLDRNLPVLAEVLRKAAGRA
jgi:glycosyltransferase involved in cell wall biosynthesis